MHGHPDLERAYDIAKSFEQHDELMQLSHEASVAYAEAAAKVEFRQTMAHFARGYDGVDKYVDGMGETEIRPWNDEPPTYPDWDGPAERYDFRGVMFQDLRERHRE